MKLIYQSKPKVKFQNLSKENWKRKLLDDLRKIPGFWIAYFFGSFARAEDEPWSDVDIIIILDETLESVIDSKNTSDNSTPMGKKDSENFFQNLLLVSEYISDYPELEPLVYSKKQWEAILDDPEPIGFWKDVRNDLMEL
jgi:hypothetical protein